MGHLLILASTLKEIDLLISQLREEKIINIGKKLVYHGVLFNYEVQLLVTGIGVANAAHALTASICHKIPRLVWLIGCGGAYPESGLKIGDFALAEKEIWAEAGAYTEAGFRPLNKIDLPYLVKDGVCFYNCFPADEKLNNLVAKSIMPLLSNSNLKTGPFLTVSATTGNQKRLSLLRGRFFGICENMEGAAIAQICTIYEIPFLELRCISNIVGGYDKENWEIDLASKRCQRLVLNLLEGGIDLCI